MRKCCRWVRLHPVLFSLLVILMGFVAINTLAFMHAHAMTHFVVGRERTRSPESLSSIQKAKVLLTGVRIPKPQNTVDPASLGLHFRRHEFTETAGITYEAWHIPCHDSRGLCILFHGYAASKSSLLPEAQAWFEMGYETLLVDFRGCGGSSGRETTIGFKEADDVVAAIEYVRRTLTEEPPILYGRSMGAVAILRALSLRDLGPRAVIVECPFDRLLSTAKNRFSAMGIPSFPSSQLLVFWGGVQHGYSGFRHNPVDYVKAVDCPVLVMHGERDPRVTTDQATAVFRGFPGDKEFVLFKEAGHDSCLNANPDRWRRAVATFLHDQR